MSSLKRRVLIALLFTLKYFVVHICLKEAKHIKTLPLTKTNYGGYSSGNVKWAQVYQLKFISVYQCLSAQVYQWLVDFPNQWIAILARFDVIARHSEYPWLFTVLRQEPRWRLVSTHFRDEIWAINGAIVHETNTKAATNFGFSVFTGRYKIIFMQILQPNRKNILDKIPKRFVNCKQSSN